MKDMYVTIVGMNHYYGLKPFKVGKKIRCVKEKGNVYDSEAIRAVVKHIGKVGYVANSYYTTITGTYSAGRIYEKVKKEFTVRVMFVAPYGVICKVVDGFKEKKQDKLLVDEVVYEDDEL
jgi:hypothetical protein